MERIISSTGASSYQLWLSDKKDNNFRYKLTNNYKANRTKPLPRHYHAVRQYLEQKWSAQVAHGQEADDALGIDQSQAPEGSTCICSIDKDLLQIPGLHYNWVAEEKTTVTPQQGLAHFYQQILTGDKTDNILSPCYRMGKEKAQKLLAYCESEEDMFEIVKEQYNDDNLLLLNGQLLWIRKAPNQMWSLPILK